MLRSKVVTAPPGKANDPFPGANDWSQWVVAAAKGHDSRLGLGLTQPFWLQVEAVSQLGTVFIASVSGIDR